MKPISDNLLFALAAASTALVVLTGGYSYLVHPEHPGRTLLALGVIGAAWALRLCFRCDATTTALLANQQRRVTQSIVFAGLLLSFALITRLGMDHGAMEFGQRCNGVLSGAVVMFFANTMPKQVSSARFQPLLRIGGWALVLGGLGISLSWLLLPLAYANHAALVLLLTAISYAAVRIAWSLRG